MTQEQKAKAYDEAKARMSIAFNSNRCTIGFINEIFPELKESEDERIRKELVNFVKSRLAGFPDCKRFTDWLEKQGRKDVMDINQSEFESSLNTLLKQFEKLPKEELANSLSFYLNVVQNNGIYKDEEKQGKQKPTDKFVPKFHEGDWVMLDRPVLITKVEDMPYNTHQYWTSDGTWFGNAAKAKLWTIQEAKDGDVLVASDKSLFIYDGSINENGSVGFHIALTEDMDIILNSDDGCGWEKEDSCHPATKEQRDQLEKAMADAGYIFDFEKKELKEIEDEEYDGEDYGIDSLWHAKNILEKTLGKVDGYQTDDGILDHKCAISAVNKLYKQKPSAWSEEDTKMVESIITGIKYCKKAYNNYAFHENEIGWLQSLKDRYTWKPSEEQMKILFKYAEQNNYDGSALTSLYQDLKKLMEE